MSEDRPPLLGSWRNLYGFVAAVLIAQIILYWLITRAYAP